MAQPIIDPSTLTEEQRKEIKERYDENAIWEMKSSAQLLYSGFREAFEYLFGENFFKKGE